MIGNTLPIMSAWQLQKEPIVPLSISADLDRFVRLEFKRNV